MFLPALRKFTVLIQKKKQVTLTHECVTYFLFLLLYILFLINQHYQVKQFHWRGCADLWGHVTSHKSHVSNTMSRVN
jgi:hypothetical protein